MEGQTLYEVEMAKDARRGAQIQQIIPLLAGLTQGSQYVVGVKLAAPPYIDIYLGDKGECVALAAQIRALGMEAKCYG